MASGWACCRAPRWWSTGSRRTAAAHWTVDSNVDSLADLPALKLSWEVRDTGQGPRIVDIKVAGVSLFMTRRSEFNAVIQKSGGQIEPLVAELEARAAR